MSLRHEAAPCWVVTCDGCGEGDNHEYGGSFHHHDEADARESLQGSDWILSPDGRALCFDCVERMRGEVACPDGSHCTSAGCGSCPSDEDLFARLGEEEERHG